jgi:hypothetical protein
LTLGTLGGLSGNQHNVANALNNVFNTGGTLPPGFSTVFGLTGSNLGNALSSLSGEATTGGQQASFQMTNQFLGLMLDPFMDGRSGIAGSGGPALGFAPERDEALPDDVVLAYSSVLKAVGAGANLRAALGRLGRRLWRQQQQVRRSGGRRQPRAFARTAGFTGGLDYRLTPNTVIGHEPPVREFIPLLSIQHP